MLDQRMARRCDGVCSVHVNLSLHLGFDFSNRSSDYEEGEAICYYFIPVNYAFTIQTWIREEEELNAVLREGAVFNIVYNCSLVKYRSFKNTCFSFQNDTSGMGNVPWFSLLTMVTISTSLSFMAEGKLHFLKIAYLYVNTLIPKWDKFLMALIF